MQHHIVQPISTPSQAPPRRLWHLACAALVVLLSVSGVISAVPRADARARAGAMPLRYSIAYIIHGNGEHRVHDSLAGERMADEEVLLGAQRVAVNNPRAEVFLFHEPPETQARPRSSRDNGVFSYYRNGSLLKTVRYNQNEGTSQFEAQLRLYEKYRAPDRPHVKKFLLYFGPEITESSDEEEDAMPQGSPFTVRQLTEAAQMMTGDSTTLDLIVLSSCYNGTPYTITTLSPYAKAIVASPGNIHPSYFDEGPFEQLDLLMADGNVLFFAREFARHAFNRLTASVQTAVTVAVYDVGRVQTYLHAVDSVDQALTAMKRPTTTANMIAEQCDCADNPSYLLPMMSEGVDVFYRPARSGNTKTKQSHSGWQCWKETARQSVTVEAPESERK